MKLKSVPWGTRDQIVIVFILTIIAITITIMFFILNDNFSFFVKTTDNHYDIPGWATLVVSTGIGIAIAIAILIYSDKEEEKLKKLVTDIHIFSEEQKSIKEAKRKRYSKVILFGLRLIDYEIEGMIIQQKFRDKKDTSMSDIERKQIQINYYTSAQKRFLDMNIEYDVILEIFNEKIETQYRKAWDALRIQSIYVNFDDSKKIWETINKIVQQFADLKNLLIEYVDDEKSSYSDLFDPKRYETS